MWGVEKCVEVIGKICSANYIGRISRNVNPDYVHVFVSVPPHLSVSKVVQYTKEESRRKLQEAFQELTKRYGDNTCGGEDTLWQLLDK
jgi:putative transposase